MYKSKTYRSVKVYESVFKKLEKLKGQNDCKTFSDVIEYLLNEKVSNG